MRYFFKGRGMFRLKVMELNFDKLLFKTFSVKFNLAVNTFSKTSFKDTFVKFDVSLICFQKL